MLTETKHQPYIPAFHDAPDLEALRERETWLSGQRQAFESALNDAPLAESLGILVDTAIAALGSGVRAAFYITDPDSADLHHVVGMSADYAQAADGFVVGPESFACGLVTHTGEAVLTADVRNDPRWEPWLWMAAKFGYRGCWSFPIHTAVRRFAGTFALYWPEPREATPNDTERAGMITQTAAIIVSRHERAEQRRAAIHKLQETQSELESELRDSELLRQISLELLDEAHEDALYSKLVEAAATIMRSEVCTVQIFHPERGPAGELQMLASRGLSPEGVRFWEWVRGDSGCTCGEVLRTGEGSLRHDTLVNWHVSRYSFGPILDGLFAQSNFGIVTRAAVWLLPRPPAIESFHFIFPQDDDLGAIIDLIRPLRLSGFVPTLFRVCNDLYAVGTEETHPEYETLGRAAVSVAARTALRDKHGLEDVDLDSDE